MFEFALPLLDIAGPLEPPVAFNSIENDIGAQAELALIDIADDFVRLYQQEVVKEGSVDTGFFLNTIRVQRASWHERDIGSDATYAGVITRKGTHRTENVGLMFPAEAIDKLGPSVENAFSRYVI